MKISSYFIASVTTTMLVQIIAVIALFRIGSPEIGTCIALITLACTGVLIRDYEDPGFSMLMSLMMSSLLTTISVVVFNKYDALIVAFGLLVGGLCMLTLRARMHPG